MSMKEATDYLAGYFPCTMLSAGGSAVSKLNCDVVGEDTLNGSLVEGTQDGE